MGVKLHRSLLMGVYFQSATSKKVFHVYNKKYKKSSPNTPNLIFFNVRIYKICRKSKLGGHGKKIC